jgi:hypothetical protein
MNDLVNRIANGEATLLGIDDICTRLGVSRTTFDRWVKNGAVKSVANAALQSGVGGNRPYVSLFETAGESSLKFPPPDIRIGNSPKWEMATFKKWLTANVTN